MSLSKLLPVLGLVGALTNHPGKKCLGKDCYDLKQTHFLDKVTPERCAILQNTQNAVYTVQVKIGTPAKDFRLVADTGSNVLVIPGSNCESCDEAHKVLYDPEKSSTMQDSHKNSRITYGSGPVTGKIYHDTVSAIGVTSHSQSLLAMKTQHIKNFGAFSFDGIMGMGMPVSSMGVKGEDPAGEKSFFAQAGVDAFTMCFAKGPRPNGVLKLGSKRNATFMFEQVIGQVHWGVALSTVHIGGKKVGNVCDSENGCAVIVDSGTTLMMAPSAHLVRMYAHLCDFLPGCKAMAEAVSSPRAKALLFRETLLTCPKEMDQLPNLDFQLGANTVSLSKNTYIMKANTKEVGLAGFVGGIDEAIDLSSVSQHYQVCVPAFMHMKMRSRNHGPIWIFGMPLMREYTVMFNRGDGKPNVGFSRTKSCTGCQEGGIVSSLVNVKTDMIDNLEEEEHSLLSPAFIRQPNLKLYDDKSGHVHL